MKRLLIAALILSTLLIPQLVFGEESENEWYFDVEENSVYKDAIQYMTDSEFVEGYASGNFLPMEDINRVEALKMILESSSTELQAIENRELKEFPDIDPDAW